MLNIPPAFPGEAVTVVYAADENFAACTGVSLSTVLRRASPARRYDVVLLLTGAAEGDRAAYSALAEGMENVSVRCFDAGGLTDGRALYAGGRPDFSAATYFRLLLPWLLPGTGRALYLDGDTVALADVAELYDTPLGGALLAAAPDICGQGSYYMREDAERRYRTEVLQMPDPERYFNSGVLVLDLAAFRREFTAEGLLELAASYPWKSHDQDVLNRVCAGRVKFLDPAWNHIEVMWHGEYLPEGARAAWRAAGRAPRIRHYASVYKPWRVTYYAGMLDFWRAAAHTPFFDRLAARVELSGMEALADERQEAATVERLLLRGELGMRPILGFIRCWFRYKLKKWRGGARHGS